MSKRFSVHQGGFDNTRMSDDEWINKSKGAALPSSTGFPPWVAYTPIKARRLPIGGGAIFPFCFTRDTNLQEPACTSKTSLLAVTRELINAPSIRTRVES